MQKAIHYLWLLATLTLTLISCRSIAGSTPQQIKAASQATILHYKDSALCFTDEVLETTTAEIRDFYTDHGNMTVWTHRPDRLALQQAIEEAATDGLVPEDYHLNFLIQFEKLETITKDEALRYDLMMTEAFQNLSIHLFKGRLKPSAVYNDWALSPKSFEADKLQAAALQQHDIMDALNRCRPQHAIYKSLRNSLAVLNKLPDDANNTRINIHNPLKLNDSLPVVALIKQRLNYWGDLKTSNNPNVYDTETATAVKKFQLRHGMIADGIVGKQTALLLNISRNERREQVLANMERWRWFAYDFGDNAVVINIPDYRLTVLENSRDTIQTYKVVVGKPERRTPVLESEITNLVINPTWTVPPTIIKEDLTPAATEDRSYFTLHNMKIYRGENQVQPWEWNPEEYEKYSYVQNPGNHNALGRIKFNFYNSFSVYLHDTNQREHFGKDYRALSSGCIRVQDPFRLAEYILKQDNEKWDEKKLKEITDTNETKNLYIQKSIRVHQLYWTAWMDKGGLQFRNDIYSLDKILYERLRQDR